VAPNVWESKTRSRSASGIPSPSSSISRIVVLGTGTWDDYRQQKFGQLQLAPGDRLEFRSADAISNALLDLRTVMLVPAKAFLKCGDLQEGFARVRCPDCQHPLVRCSLSPATDK